LVEVVCRRCAGVDVSKRDAKVCVRVQGQGSARTTSRVSTWSSVMPQIVKLREQLVAEQVELVVIESTSDYWRPFFYVLSEAVPVMLVKASDVKGMPGRKTTCRTRSGWLTWPRTGWCGPPSCRPSRCGSCGT
jgi:transposase